jgi:nucleotide-binding universal stress UspA family protein
MSLTRPVLVGIERHTDHRPALELAAWEARRLHRPLRLIHAYRQPSSYPMLGPVDIDVRAPLLAARRMLAEAADQVRDRHPDLRVGTQLAVGSAAGVLVGESRYGDRLVIGASERESGRRQVLSHVITHAHCTVLVAAPDQAAAGPAVETGTGVTPGGAGPVVVGVDGSPSSAAALAFGAEEADARGVALVPAYVYYLLPDTNLGPHHPRWAAGPQAADVARRMLAESAAGWTEKYPGLRVDQVTVCDPSPTDALERLSADAGLLVVGCRGRGGFAGLLLGSVAREISRRARCAVAVVHPHDS